MIGKFFHIERARRFNIPPRYHDPEQEERDDRESRIKEELGIKEEKLDDGKPFKANIKGQFRYSLGRNSKSAQDARRSSNTRLIILILILALLFYLFFYSDILF